MIPGKNEGNCCPQSQHDTTARLRGFASANAGNKHTKVIANTVQGFIRKLSNLKSTNKASPQPVFQQNV